MRNWFLFFFYPRRELKNHFTSFFASIDCCAVLSHFSRVRLFVTPQTVAHQAPLSIGFSRQECWSGLPSPPPGDLPDPGIEPSSLKSPALAGGFFTTGTPGKPNRTKSNTKQHGLLVCIFRSLSFTSPYHLHYSSMVFIVEPQLFF